MHALFVYNKLPIKERCLLVLHEYLGIAAEAAKVQHTRDTLTHCDLLQQPDGTHVARITRKLCLQLQADFEQLCGRRDCSLHQPSKGACMLHSVLPMSAQQHPDLDDVSCTLHVALPVFNVCYTWPCTCLLSGNVVSIWLPRSPEAPTIKGCRPSPSQRCQHRDQAS